MLEILFGIPGKCVMSRKEDVCFQEWYISQDELQQSGYDCVLNHSDFDKVCLDQVIIITSLPRAQHS